MIAQNVTKCNQDALKMRLGWGVDAQWMVWEGTRIGAQDEGRLRLALAQTSPRLLRNACLSQHLQLQCEARL